MVFSIGQRVLPAFGGARVLHGDSGLRRIRARCMVRTPVVGRDRVARRHAIRDQPDPDVSRSTSAPSGPSSARL